MAGRGQAAILALGLATLPGCGGNKGPEAWVTADSAFVQCTTAGRSRTAPIMLDLPMLDVPTGLFARGLDPMALDDLGFERDEVACVTLEAPSEEVIDEAAAGLKVVVDLQEKVSRDARRVAGRCSCEVAREVGAHDLLVTCIDEPTNIECEWDGRDEGEMGEIVKPLREAILASRLAFVHWRLVGITDRPGWFADHLPSLLDRHPGGSTVYLRGSAIPQRENFELLRRLLDSDNVQAVVRQDSGRAVVAIREIDKELVVDYFLHPTPGARRKSLLGYIQNARADDYIAALERPASTRKLALDPKKGNLVQLDSFLLERVDRALIAGSWLMSRHYDGESEYLSEPPVYAQRISLQAPFGSEGVVLKGRLELSSDGQQWAQLLSADVLSPTLEELGLSEAEPAFRPARGTNLPFYLRGTLTWRLWVHGLHAFPQLMRQIEIANPTTIKGSATEFVFDLPTDDLWPELEVDPALEGLRGRLGRQAYRLEGTFTAKRDAIDFELHPR